MYTMTCRSIIIPFRYRAFLLAGEYIIREVFKQVNIPTDNIKQVEKYTSVLWCFG